MTSDLAFTIFRIGFLILLWLMVFGVVSTLKRDIFGTVVTSRGSGKAKQSGKRAGDRRDVGSNVPTRLLITGGPLEGTLIPLGTQPITVGRSPSSTLVLEDPYASSRHAELRNVNGQWAIADLGSTNGTFVDDERVVDIRVLPVGTAARIGQTTFELVN
ncbi:FHA domain-containing protein [Actinomycetaceae bacterium MB13-C1-2]|nr:FHA domain-containing protein [Actinomycetaceae bacterium MB13-C1-2]